MIFVFVQFFKDSTIMMNICFAHCRLKHTKAQVFLMCGFLTLTNLNETRVRSWKRLRSSGTVAVSISSPHFPEETPEAFLIFQEV